MYRLIGSRNCRKGVAAWNRSACLDTRLVETCQPSTNCVTVTVGDGDDADGNFDAVESGGFTTGGHIDLSSSLTGGERTNVTIHEMGHAVGLAHRLTERVLMNGDTYDDVFDPDEIDFQNLLVIYGGQGRARVAPGVEPRTGGEELFEGGCEIWIASISEFTEHQAALDGVLTPDERAHVDRVREGRATARLSRGLLRLVLARYLDLPPAEIEIDRSCPDCGRSHGRPRLVGRPRDGDRSHRVLGQSRW